LTHRHLLLGVGAAEEYLVPERHWQLALLSSPRVQRFQPR
jgi:hypothetical protein